MTTATVPTSKMTRREFLYYIWGASMALLTAEFAGTLIWFLIPRFREGEFGGRFPVLLENLPPVNAEPGNFAEGRFWLSNIDTTQPNDRMYQTEGDPDLLKGVVAIYKVCTHLGCIYAWNTINNRFECPCHGSKYRLDGRRIESPAPRTLDRFELSALDADGNILATSVLDDDDFYLPLELPAATVSLSVDTGSRKQGPTQRLICDIRNNCP